MQIFRDFLNRKKFYVFYFIRNFLTRNQNQASIFFDLSPVNNADPNGIYTKALDEAMKNVNVQNIALTGPYGSGKTSVIRTFEKSTRYKFLNISLAAFANPKAEEIEPSPISNEQSLLIERSILQQMLYGADSDSLPYSRFKRISIPKKLEIKSIIFTSWLLLLFLTYLNKDSLLKKISFTDPNWLWVFILLFIFSISAFIFAHLFKAKHSFSVKKLSLHNGEVEVGDVADNSVLNRYLDEIIYFFEATKYDLMVIEDLDRFGSTEIFVKLREINKIINDRRSRYFGIWKIKFRRSPIKFLYAIKDDMFDNKSRAKFFDFIVPIIPIINNSNSKVKFLEKIKEIKFNKEINLQFIKEVSLYIDDLRLINNIINEFIIYESKIGSESLNRTKLLAVIIYKNVYPNDFENLHYGKGALYAVCEQRLKLMQEKREKIKNDINSARLAFNTSQAEVAQSVEDLVKIFWSHLYRYSQGRLLKGIYINGNSVSLDQLFQWDTFSQAFNLTNIALALGHAHNSNLGEMVYTGKSFLDVQSEINPTMTFEQRKNLIYFKARPKQNDFVSQIKSLEKQSVLVSKMSLSELLNQSEFSLKNCLSDCKISAPELLLYLIRNGYLDENYYLYTSNFHEGSITKRDRDFLLAIRDFRAPDPTQAIDTPDEVCDEMRAEDFEHEYALNVHLIDHLLTTKNKNKTSSVVRFISENFIQSGNFFNAYWAAGKNLEVLTKVISENWADYASKAIESDWAAEHVAAILAYVDPACIEQEVNEIGKLSDYVSNNAGAIFSVRHVFFGDYAVLKFLNVKIARLYDLPKSLLDYLHTHDLYKISLENIQVILNVYPVAEYTSALDKERANYTCIRTFGSDNLNRYIANNFSEYINSVFLSTPDNSSESEEFIMEILNKEELTKEQKISVIDQQNLIFTSLDRIPQYMWNSVLLLEKIGFTWANILKCFNCDEHDRDAIKDVLNRNHVVDFLSKEKISKEIHGAEPSLELSRFIISNNDLTDENYLSLCGVLPYSFVNFPAGLSNNKLISLVKVGVVKLNEDSFNFSEDNEDLRFTLIIHNLQKYVENKSKFELNDQVKEMLVLSDIESRIKEEIARDISSVAVIKSRQLSDFITDLLVLPHTNIFDFEKDVVSACIVNSIELKKSIIILTKALDYLDKTEVLKLLGQLPEPYCEIASAGKRPKLINTDENTKLATQLVNREFVSSVKDEDEYIRIITFQT